MTRRVAVTGIGTVSAFGDSFAEFWSGISEGRSAIRPLKSATVRFPNAAEVPDFQPSKYFDEKDAGFLDLFAQFAAVAAREAVGQSGIEFTDELREKTAIVLGSSGGGKATEDEGFHSLYALQQ